MSSDTITDTEYKPDLAEEDSEMSGKDIAYAVLNVLTILLFGFMFFFKNEEGTTPVNNNAVGLGSIFAVVVILFLYTQVTLRDPNVTHNLTKNLFCKPCPGVVDQGLPVPPNSKTKAWAALILGVLILVGIPAFLFFNTNDEGEKRLYDNRIGALAFLIVLGFINVIIKLAIYDFILLKNFFGHALDVLITTPAVIFGTITSATGATVIATGKVLSGDTTLKEAATEIKSGTSEGVNIGNEAGGDIANYDTTNQ